MGERRGRAKQRNTNRGLMGMDNGGDCLWESWWAGWGRAMGKKAA